jgi:hypothetical protein
MLKILAIPGYPSLRHFVEIRQISFGAPHPAHKARHVAWHLKVNGRSLGPMCRCQFPADISLFRVSVRSAASAKLTKA